jgi:5-methyltetrahydrofolate--homocysteine methyltransferase
MHGLELAKRIVKPGGLDELIQDLELKRAAREKERAARAAAAGATATERKIAPSNRRSSSVRHLEALPVPPDFEAHVLRNTPIDQIWSFINPLMLYGRHLGLKGSVVRLLEKHAQGEREASLRIREEDPKALEVWEAVERVKERYRNTEFLKPASLWKFFKASSQGNSLGLFDQAGTTQVAEFQFPRQKREDGLCLSDYTREKKEGTPASDSVALFVVTVGRGVREEADRLKEQGQYLESHILQVLALESAEGYAELLHSKIRALWGHPDSTDITLMQRFQAKYRGKRYSFGYPACPRLDDQKTLWDLLKPEQLDVELTDGFMMDPEASVSALVFHHPDATYFSVGSVTGETGAEENRQS